jgi:uncharacterized repeat protein (TIGR01451 family)
MRRPLALPLLAAILSPFLPTTARADTFAPGTLIIPMDTTYQDMGMLRAYGLVYELLRNGVPIRWVIRKGKVNSGTDFTASAVDTSTSATVTAHGYRGGPFVIDAADAAKAMPIITQWQAVTPKVNVHKTTSTFEGDVARKLLFAPTIAMHADGNQKIARGYMQAAGIPDSTLSLAWADSSPDMLTPAKIAGPTTTNHRDGSLFDQNGVPRYCQFMSMHWGVKEAEASPETVAEVREFLKHPVHFFAECQAVSAFENNVNGHFLTNGYAFGSQPSKLLFLNDDTPFAQLDGPFGTVGGSEASFSLLPGESYKGTDTVMITDLNTPVGKNDVWMTGFLDGACGARVSDCGGIGKVSYLGGHQYTVSLPISKNPTTQGTRLFLNSLFEAPCAAEGGQPVLVLTKLAPASTVSDTVTYTIVYANTGPGVALGAVVSDALPAGASFVSASNGGAFAGGKVTWNLGNLGPSASGSLTLTVKLGSLGTYKNQAQIAFKIGLTPSSGSSNTTSTIYDKDTDGDGVVDSLDICPNVPNPAQDLSTDVLSCGACGVVCKAPGGTPGCAAGACFIAGCNAGKSDCDGLSANGCEYDNAGFTSDAKNCGACNIACSPANGVGSCVAGACAIGACNEGFFDCNGLAGDGCEYSGALFQNDPLNCGACGKSCAAAGAQTSCSGGACVVTSCAAGKSDCDGLASNGCEYDDGGFLSDPENCGGCGISCEAPGMIGLCDAGACKPGPCAEGFVDLDGDASNGCEYACTFLGNSDATCDGKDDDCDGKADEDFVGAPCGVGACTSLSVCVAGQPSCTPGMPSVEGPTGAPSCFDGADNDCSGQADAEDPACACSADADCDDSDPCTEDACLQSACSHAPIADCGDGGAGGEAGAAGDGGASGSTGAAGEGGAGEGGAGGGAGPGTGGAGGDAGAAAGGQPGAGGSAGAGAQGGTSGASGTGGAGASSGSGGAGSGGGGASAGSAGVGGASGNAGSASAGKGGAPGASGSAGNAGPGNGAVEGETAAQEGGCGCKVAGVPSPSSPAVPSMLGLLGLALFGRRRRETE